MEQATTQLFAALVAAQKAAHGVEKASKNKHFNYKYAAAEDILEESRRTLNPHGLAFTPTSYAVTVREDDSGGMLSAAYLLVHESGETLAVTSMTPVIPEKGRPMDKAVAVAKTYDLSYTLRGLLLLPRIEEGAEVDTRDDRDYVPPERQHKELDEKLSAFVGLLGAQRCREIVGGSPRTPAEKAEAVRKLEAAQLAAARGPAPHGSTRQAAPPQSDEPPPKLRAVPPTEHANDSGQAAKHEPSQNAKKPADGAKSDSRSQVSTQDEPAPAISSNEFWTRVKATGKRLSDARREICERFNLTDAGRASASHWLAYLTEIEEQAKHQNGGAR